MIYDDGSYDVQRDGATYAYDTSGQLASATSSTGQYWTPPGYSQDNREAVKLGQFYPPDKPWWAGLATYGATRAIDAHFGPPPTVANGPGTFAGDNGRTQNQGRLRSGGAVQDDGGMMMLLLIGLAAFALVG